VFFGFGIVGAMPDHRHHGEGVNDRADILQNRRMRKSEAAGIKLADIDSSRTVTPPPALIE
jgi:hypothetical protein